MTYFLAFPISDELQRNIEQVKQNLAEGSSVPQSKQAAQNTQAIVDEMLQAFLFVHLDRMKIRPVGEKMIKGIAKIIQKTADGLVGRLVSKRSNEEIGLLMDFLDQNTVIKNIDGKPQYFVGQALTDEQYQELIDIIAQVEAENYEGQKLRLGTLLDGMIEAGLELSLNGPTQVLKVGRITQKIVDLAHAGIRKVLHSGIPKMVGGMNYKELAVTLDLLKGYIVEEDTVSAA